MTPKISVIFPVAQREAYLAEAIESILGQSFTDFELLIIQDGSSPQVISIIEGYRDQRIKIIRFPLNMGTSVARNAGLIIAKAPYTAIMDSDDVAFPDRLQQQYFWMESHPEVTVCGTNFIKMFNDGIRTSVCYPESDGIIKSRLLVVDSAIHNPTTMFRTEFVRQYGMQYDSNFPRDQDYRFFVEMMMHGATFYNLQEELLLYRRHESNANANVSYVKIDAQKTKVREILLPLLFPELTGEENQVLLKGFCDNIRMKMVEACFCVVVMNKALREKRTFIGEDREELRKILLFYRDRLVNLINGKTATPDTGSNG